MPDDFDPNGPDGPMALLDRLVEALRGDAPTGPPQLQLHPEVEGTMPPIPPPLPFEIRSLPSPNHYRGRAGVEADVLLLHYTAGKGNALATARVFASPTREASAHFTVGRGHGDVVQCVDLDDAAWSAGDGGKARLPSSAQLLATDADAGVPVFVPIGLVPPAPKLNNRRAVAIEICNRGFAPGGANPRVSARHRNPACGSTSWEAYDDEQIDTLVALARHIVAAVPTLRWVAAHEDCTHADTLGDVFGTVEIERKSGGKVDVGPAFPWDRMPLGELHLQRVAYDFKRHGWRIEADPG